MLDISAGVASPIALAVAAWVGVRVEQLRAELRRAGRRDPRAGRPPGEDRPTY